MARSSASWSLTRRLVLSIVLLLTVVWSLAMAGIYWHTREHVHKLLDMHLMQTAVLLSNQSPEEIDDDELEHVQKRSRERIVAQDEESADLDDVPTIFQVWRDGVLIAHSRHAPQQALADGHAGFSRARLDDRRWRVYTEVADTPNGQVRVMVAEDLHLRDDIVLGNVRGLLVGLLLAFPATALLVWWLVRRAMRPLQQAGAAIRERQPQAHAPLQLDDVPREVQPLIDALNQLFGRIGELLHKERRFTADAAHELRTPIAAIRMMAQVAQGAEDVEQRQQALDGVVQGCDRATRLVEQLLQLARLEAESDTGTEWPVADLMPALDTIVQELQQTQAASRGQCLSWQAPEQLPARMQPALAAVLLRNLLDNALRYSPDGAEVRVLLQALPGQRMCWIVEDSGPGMAEEDMQRLGERFFRVLGTGRSGSGLGWSIVRRIAALYGLRLQVDRSPELGGLCVRLQG
ncbi:ATP-binding protein [Brachymonas sp. G13]|uniref:ATP-binding protein n=1 Tax=Brachymonas TaxID=28219 RepID=UPI0016935D2B|nr:ATP-binding protein [Brachymonas sp. J145]MEE1654002.1 ATP-binding protein [Brachymonas sp. J145]NLX17478.1 two-component sensor histidine kinase [Ramlibacter sp.]